MKHKSNIPSTIKVKEKPQQNRVGLMTFKVGLTQADLKSILSDKDRILLGRSPIYNYNEQQFVDIRVALKYADSWDFSLISASGFKAACLLKQIEHVNMSKLAILNLDQNNVTSIESICKLHAPSLDCISLKSNNITCIKSLRKAYFPVLTRIYINLADNCYYSQFHSKLLETIQCSDSRKHNRYQKFKNNSISWIAKVQSPKLRRILTPEMDFAENLNHLRFKVLLRRKKKKQEWITV